MCLTSATDSMSVFFFLDVWYYDYKMFWSEIQFGKLVYSICKKQTSENLIVWNPIWIRCSESATVTAVECEAILSELKMMKNFPSNFSLLSVYQGVFGTK